jgi:hypothetical protein
MYKILTIVCLIILLVSNIVLGVCVHRLSKHPRIEYTFNDTGKNTCQDSLLTLQRRDISLLRTQVHLVASVLWNRLNVVRDYPSQILLRKIIIGYADSSAIPKIVPGKKLILVDNDKGGL